MSHVSCVLMFVCMWCIIVSGAMALPFSSFPNVNSLLMVDDFRKSYLTTSDFVLTGLPLSILTMLLISTLACTFVSLVI